MLVRFSVENYTNFKERLEFSFKVGEYTFNTDAVKNAILRTAVIYGPNGSGKSNLGCAIMDIVSVLTEKHTEMKAHYANLDNKSDVASFEYEFKFNKSSVIYKYSKNSAQEILKEELLINDEKMVYYTSDKILINFKNAKNLQLDLKNKSPQLSLVKYVYLNTIFEPRVEQNIAFKNLFKFVNNMLYFYSLTYNSYIGFRSGVETIDK
ncbi:MAG: ATP-binding protein, partial [Deferribacteraceae bacterium]|nr:ATP-binding protein [Deferribacteraceae bacterium]